MIGPVFLGVLARLAVAPIQGPHDTLPPALAAAARALDADSIEQAIRLAERYTQRAQRDPRGFLVLGDAYARRMPAGRFRALEAYRNAQRLAPHDPDPPYRMAQMGLWLGGDDGERIARDELERVLDLDSFFKDAWDLWLTLYRNGGGRAKMIARLGAHRRDPRVQARLAQLLVENEAYIVADRLLDSALASDSRNAGWLALRAQSALEAGDTTEGLAFYRRALDHASEDSAEVLWRQVIGIATPAELRAWPGVPAKHRGVWLQSFWARRNPNLFAGVNGRVAEHFARLRHARKHFPLLHPLVSYHRSALARTLNLEPSEGERAFHLRCEVYQDLMPSSGLHVQLPGVSSRREVSRAGMGALSHLTPEEKESARSATAAALRSGTPIPRVIADAIQEEGGVALAFAPTTFAALGFDVRNVDSTAGRVGYNLATGLDDRGLMYLRFGAPEKLVLGGDNSVDPQCASNELERWRYTDWGEVRFARPTAFSHGLRTTPEMVFRPMNERQFETMKVGLTRDASSEAAPLEFGVWTAHFRNAADLRLVDLVVVATRGEVAAALVPDTGGALGPREGATGYVTLPAAPGQYALLVHARDADTLGRQSLSVGVRPFGFAPGMSDLLVSAPWVENSVSRAAMLTHVRRDLTFRVGESVRVFAELYGLPEGAGRVTYRATYRLLRTRDASRDIRSEEWPGALTFEFDRERPRAEAVETEILDLDPRYLSPGTYLLRLEVRDNAATAPLGRSTIALVVR